MALNRLIPAVWTAQLLKNLRTNLVFASAAVCNTDYEGEIKDMGNTVKIHGIGAINVKPYTKGSPIDAPDTLDDTEVILLIDQGDYFNFGIDDVDAAQQNPKVMAQAMSDASYSLRKVADTYMATIIAAAVSGGNTLGSTGSPIIPTKDTAYEYLVNLGVVLDQTDTPDDGQRWAAVPPWFHGMLQKDARFVSYGTDKNRDTLKNGEIGEAAGFKILKTNQVKNAAGKYNLCVGHRMATTYADQIVKVKGYEPESGFSEAVKGLHVYGGKVVRPAQLAQLICSPA